MSITVNYWLAVIVISIVGTLAHFLYDWTHHNKIIGLFAAVNESTWEHIKIAITPTLLWSLYDGILYGANPNYFLGKFVSLIALVIIIPTLYYSYKKIFKRQILPFDIAIFYIAILFSQLLFYVIICAPPVLPVFKYLSCIGTFIFFGAYMTLTLAPLRNFIFKDPINGKYGFRAHTDLIKKVKNRTKSRRKK